MVVITKFSGCFESFCFEVECTVNVNQSPTSRFVVGLYVGHSVPVFLFGIHGLIILLHPRTLWNVNILVAEVVLKVLRKQPQIPCDGSFVSCPCASENTST